MGGAGADGGQLPRFLRPLADALGVNQLAGLHDAVHRAETVFEDGDFAAGDGGVGGGALVQGFQGDGDGFAERIGYGSAGVDHLRVVQDCAVQGGAGPYQQRTDIDGLGGDDADFGRFAVGVASAEKIHRHNALVVPLGQVAEITQRGQFPVGKDAVLVGGGGKDFGGGGAVAGGVVAFPHQRQHRLLGIRQNLRFGTAQPLVNLDAAYFAQVKAPAVKKVIHNESAGAVHLHGRLAGAQPFVDVALGQADAVRLLPHILPVGVHPVPQGTQFLLARVIVAVVGGQCAGDKGAAVVVVHIGEQGAHFLRADDAQGVEESGYVHPALAVDADADGFGQVAAAGVVVRPGGELNAGAPAGGNAALVVPVFHLAAFRAGRILRQFPVVIDAGGALELADQHPLGAVDDESAGFGHHRHVAKENFRFLHFAGFPVQQPRPHPQGLRVGNFLLAAFLRAERRGVEPVLQEIQLKPFGAAGAFAVGEPPGDAGHDGRAVLEGFRHPLGLEPVEGFDLAADEGRHVQGVADPGIGVQFDVAGGQAAVVAGLAFAGQYHKEPPSVTRGSDTVSAGERWR